LAAEVIFTLKFRNSRISVLASGRPGAILSRPVLQKSWVEEAWKPGSLVGHYAVRHLERLPLGTSYTAVCSRMAELFATSPLAQGLLAVDYTGAGRPVVDLLRRRLLNVHLAPVTITGGQKCRFESATGWSVPKKHLVHVLQLLLEHRDGQDAPSQRWSCEELRRRLAVASVGVVGA
jgi:hypothetical protein